MGRTTAHGGALARGRDIDVPPPPTHTSLVALLHGMVLAVVTRPFSGVPAVWLLLGQGMLSLRFLAWVPECGQLALSKVPADIVPRDSVAAVAGHDLGTEHAGAGDSSGAALLVRALGS
jgi:hypothetical protein